MTIRNTNITIEQLTLLAGIAEADKVIADKHEHRVLWYKGLVLWCNVTEVKVSSEGMGLLYAAEEKGLI